MNQLWVKDHGSQLRGQNYGSCWCQGKSSSFLDAASIYKNRNTFTNVYLSLNDSMPFGSKSGKKKTVDLRKKQSFFDTLRKKRTHASEDELLKCKICFKKISNVSEFCDGYLTRSKRCNAGPFCSEKCLREHMENVSHY